MNCRWWSEVDWTNRLLADWNMTVKGLLGSAAGMARVDKDFHGNELIKKAIFEYLNKVPYVWRIK